MASQLVKEMINNGGIEAVEKYLKILIGIGIFFCILLIIDLILYFEKNNTMLGYIFSSSIEDIKITSFILECFPIVLLYFWYNVVDDELENLKKYNRIYN